MRWPWKRQKVEPVQARSSSGAEVGQPPTGELQRSREALAAAEHVRRKAAARRPAVDAAGRDLERTITRNHLAELVRGALGSGS